MMPLMPSPGRPKTVSTPQSIRRVDQHVRRRVGHKGSPPRVSRKALANSGLARSLFARIQRGKARIDARAPVLRHNAARSTRNSELATSRSGAGPNSAWLRQILTCLPKRMPRNAQIRDEALASAAPGVCSLHALRPSSIEHSGKGMAPALKIVSLADAPEQMFGIRFTEGTLAITAEALQNLRPNDTDAAARVHERASLFQHSEALKNARAPNAEQPRQHAMRQGQFVFAQLARAMRSQRAKGSWREWCASQAPICEA